MKKIKRRLVFVVVTGMAVVALTVWLTQPKAKSLFIPSRLIHAHPDPVIRLAFSPKGDLLVTRGTSDRTESRFQIR